MADYLTPGGARIALHLRLDRVRSEPRDRYMDRDRRRGEEAAADAAAHTRIEHTLQLIALTDRQLWKLLDAGWDPRAHG